MLPLWALAVVLAVRAEALDLQLPALGNLPVALPSGPVANSVPLVVPREPLRRSPSVPKGSPPGNVAVATKGRTCSPVARYFISAGKLEDYLGAALPPQIEKLLKSEKVNLAGLLGTLLSTVGDSGLLSLLNTSTLDILGSGSLVGILSQGSSGKSRQLPLLSEATGAVSDVLPLGQEGLGSLLPISPDRNSLKRLLDGAGLSGVQQPLNDVVNNVGQLRDSTQDVLSGALQSDIGESLTGLLGNINVEELLLGLEVQKVTVENMKSTVASDGIQVHVTTTAFVGGKGLAGPVISLVGFEVHGDMALKIGTSTDSTHCVKLQVLEKAIKPNKVTLQITKTLTDALPLPLPVPLPLDDIIPQLLTVKMNENTEDPDSSDIILSDDSDCKNSTGLFTYTIRSSRMSAEGLSTLYCAKARFNKNTVPVRGSQLPPDVKNANASLTLSHSMLRTIVTYAAKQSSLKTSDLDASIIKIAYSIQPGNEIQATYWLNVRKEDAHFATVQTNLIISHVGKISRDKLLADIKLERFEHSSIPPEALGEVQDVATAILKRFWSVLTEFLQQWNIPPGVIPDLLTNVKVEVLKSTDLMAAK